MIADGVRARVRQPPRRGSRYRLRRPNRRLVGALAGLVVLLAGGWLWLRDSSLVAVQRVTVTGASGPDAAQIRSALTSAAQKMTTLDVGMKQLNVAVAPFPVVKGLQVATQFPHGIQIHVLEEIPVAAIVIGHQTIAVGGDGLLLHHGASGQLPVIDPRAAPAGSRLTDPTALKEVAMLAAAPWQLLAKLTGAGTSAGRGLSVQLRNGPAIYFGDATRLRAKWAAAIAVLANSSSAGAVYIDVSDPVRPAAGPASPGAATATTAGSTGSPAVSAAGVPAAGVPAAGVPAAGAPATGAGTTPAAAGPAATPTAPATTTTSGG